MAKGVFGREKRPTEHLSDSVSLFGFDFAATTVPEAVETIIALSRAPRASFIVTANVDHVVDLASNRRFREAYAHAALRVADGAPVVMAARLFGTPLPGRVAGSDLVEPLCRRADELGLPIAIVGGQPSVNALAVEHLRSRLGVTVIGINTPQGFDTNSLWSQELVADIRRVAAPVVLFCCGAPRSEIWLSEHGDELPHGAYLSAGAAVDFLAGTKSRAPMVMQRLGLEWLYRLVLEPRRLWRRYLVKDPKFVYLVARELMRRRRRSHSASPDHARSKPSSTMHVGVDVVTISDVASSVETFGDRYLDSIFTPLEQELCAGSEAVRVRSLAGRFAAKEAVLKSLRPASSDAVPWTSIEIRRSADGACTVELSGSAAQLQLRNNIASVDVSISHDHQTATAVAIATIQESGK